MCVNTVRGSEYDIFFHERSKIDISVSTFYNISTIICHTTSAISTIVPASTFSTITAAALIRSFTTLAAKNKAAIATIVFITAVPSTCFNISGVRDIPPFRGPPLVKELLSVLPSRTRNSKPKIDWKEPIKGVTTVASVNTGIHFTAGPHLLR
ncbi:MAG: hypothetical protein ACRD5J_19295 [Nitrososphaeraceae archaeon]